MSRTKAFLFDRLPQDDAQKSEISRERSERAKAFRVRIPTRRKNPLGHPRWDPLWPASLRNAAKELGIETMQINDGLHLLCHQERDAVVELAETLLKQRRAAIFGSKNAEGS